MDPRMIELFNRLGLGPTATKFWEAARAGDFGRAQQLLDYMEKQLAKSGNLRSAAGTLQRMKNQISGAMKAAEVTTEAAGDATVLSEEGATLAAEGVGAGEAGVGAAGAAGAGGVLVEEAPLAAGGPPGWAIIAITVVVLLVIASVAAHAETKPQQKQPPPPLPKRNPFDDLPPNLRFSSKTNPALRLNHEAPKKLKEYKDWIKKHCRCYPGVALGGNIAGRELAMMNTVPQMQCTWPNCPTKRRM